MHYEILYKLIVWHCCASIVFKSTILFAEQCSVVDVLVVIFLIICYH